MSEPTISIEGLGKAYTLYARPSDRFLDAFGLLRFLPRRRAACADFWALRDLNLVINKGERIGFVGRNGAGKSTLLKLIAGTVAPTEGQLSVNGQVQALMELGTGFHPDFTGRQNIAASLAYQGLSTREIRTLEEEIIDFAELDEFIDQPIKSYSAGMYARLAFSTATSILPEILIIDEILGAGDAYFAGKCMERMRQLTTRDGVTVLFVSHDISSVQQLCTRAVWIDRGCVQADGDTVEVVKAYYRSIQREDALRRRAKAMGLRKSRNLDGLEKQISSRTLFRFLVAGRPPEYRHKIRRLGLSNAGELISELHVGAPMDNSQDALDRLLDAPGYMEWSRAQRDVDGAFRWFEASAGEYQHAPFELGVPVANLESPEGEFELIVEGEFDPRESVRLEMYSGEAYRLIAEIEGLQGEAAFPVPHLTESAEPAAGRSEDTGANKMSDDPHPVEATGHASTPAAPGSIVDWEKPDPAIEGVRFLDPDGNEIAGIEELSDLIIEIAYTATKPVTNPVFSMSIFEANGTLLCHANTALAGVTIPRIRGHGTVTFRFPAFAAGAGEFVMGCSIFHYLEPTQYAGQPPYYDQHDRAYRFKVWKKLDNNMFLGTVRLPFQVSHRPTTGRNSG